MHLIDPFEFYQMFRDVNSVAIIGNAPCITSYRNGKKIDSYDLIVRFNRARTEGMEETIGSRTDVLFVNASNSLSKAPPPQKLCQPRCLVCFCSPQGVPSLDVSPFREWVGDCPILFSFGPDLIGLPPLHRSKPLTSGVYALFTLLRLINIKNLFVTGFTMFGAVEGGAGKYWQEAVPIAASAHDLDQEGRLFVNLLQNYKGELTVTEEVAALAKKQRVRLSTNGNTKTKPRSSLRRRLADGLSWRLIHFGMLLRRVAEKGEPNINKK